MLKFIFPSFFFPIFHSIVMHMEIWDKDSSGTTAPRILKYDTNIGYDSMYCVRENQHFSCLSFPLFVQFSFYPVKVLFRFLRRASLQILYTLTEY